jgi:hypothetical protein
VVGCVLVWLVGHVEWLFYIWWEGEGSCWSFWSAVFVWQRKKGKKEISNLDVVMSYCLAIYANNPMRSEGR